MDFVGFLSMVVYVVLYRPTQCLRYNICSNWFLDIRISTCFRSTPSWWKEWTSTQYCVYWLNWHFLARNKPSMLLNFITSCTAWYNKFCAVCSIREYQSNVVQTYKVSIDGYRKLRRLLRHNRLDSHVQTKQGIQLWVSRADNSIGKISSTKAVIRRVDKHSRVVVYRRLGSTKGRL